MKLVQSLRVLIFLLLLLVQICFGSAFANVFADGHGTGNGGDTYSQEFVSTAWDVWSRVRDFPIPGVSADRLKEAIVKTQVSSQDKLALNGVPKGAINYPDQDPPRVEVSRKDWDRMKSEMIARMKLVFHEYLGIMGVNDSNYLVSDLLSQAVVCGRTPEIRSEIEKSVRLPCDRIIADDLPKISRFTNDQYNLLEVSSLQPGDFSQLYGLEELFIQADGVKSLPPGLFQDLKGLFRMTLNIPGVSKLPAGSFDGLDGMGEDSWLDVSLDHTQPTEIEEGTFKGLSNLGSLRLIGVHFDQFPVSIFSELKNIQMLALDDHSFVGEIPSGSFKTFTNLQGPYSLLSIGAEVNQVREGAFDGLDKLHELGLCGRGLSDDETGGWIKSIEKGAFRDLGELIYFHLCLDTRATDGISPDLFAGMGTTPMPDGTPRFQSYSIEVTDAHKLPLDIFDPLRNFYLFSQEPDISDLIPGLENRGFRCDGLSKSTIHCEKGQSRR